MPTVELLPLQKGYAEAFISELKKKLNQGRNMPTIDEIKAKYGVQNDASVMTFSVPVTYSGRDVVVVKAANPQEAAKAAEKLIEGRFQKAPLKFSSLKAENPKRTGIFG